jgi:hypothetical protein
VPSGGWPSSGDHSWSSATEHGNWPAQAEDGWGPSTAVYSGTGTTEAGSSTRAGRAFNPPPAKQPADDWSPAGPLSARDQRAARAAERQAERDAEHERAAAAYASEQAVPRAPERGLPWWAALLILIAIAAVGGIIDTLGSNQLKGGFNIGIVVASIVGILVVKRSHMFPVVVAPPIVYSGAALFQLYVRSSGLHDKKVVLDAAANYLVYGFPAIAAATAAVLIIAGIRLITRK